MPRPKGVPNRDSKKVLQALEDRKFDLIHEILKLYKYNNRIIGRMFRRIEAIYTKYEELGDELPPLEIILTQDELSFFKEARGENLTILSKLFGYCFPKLKAFTVSQGLQEQIVFNINVSQGDSLKLAGNSSIPITNKKQGAIDASQKKLPVPVLHQEK